MLSQKDPKWANVQINGTKYTLKTDGCLITCLAEIAGITPPEVVNRISFSGALVRWDSIKNIGLRLSKRQDYYNNADALAALKSGKYPIIRVDYDGNPRTASDYHFVLFRGNRMMGDPIDGVEKSTNFYRILNGMRIVEKI